MIASHDRFHWKRLHGISLRPEGALLPFVMAGLYRPFTATAMFALALALMLVSARLDRAYAFCGVAWLFFVPEEVLACPSLNRPLCRTHRQALAPSGTEAKGYYNAGYGRTYY